MSYNIGFNFQYSKQQLLDLFNSSSKVESNNSTRILANLGSEPYSIPEVSLFFQAFPMIPRHENSCDFAQFIDNTRPHINNGNNGLLVFPVSGSLTLNKYSYETPEVDSEGRPFMDFLNMSAEQIADIELTKTDSVVIDTPMAINGLTTHSLHPTEPNTIVLILKIPKTESWESIVQLVQNM